MNWFRSNVGACARLSLFALMLQMAVSFGHMHADDLGLQTLGTVHQLPFSSGQSPAAPSKQNNSSAPDDYCPICASMALLATGIPSLPPILTVPGTIARVWVATTPIYGVTPRITLSFQARAPPSA
jgi:hypothetical protein